MNFKYAASRPALLSRVAKTLVAPLFALAFAGEAAAQASFSKTFSPDVIGPESTSALTFTITAPAAATDFEFTDVLPPGLVLASPPSPTLGGGCDLGTLVTAPAGGDTITFSSPRLGAGGTCTLTVDVTGDIGVASGNYDNVSSDLTSSAGNSGPAADTLEIDENRPSFSKLFSTNSTAPGQIIRLSFFIDYTGGSPVTGLGFTDNLPAGLQVAAAPDVLNTCSGGTFTATAGASSVSLVNAFLLAGTSCEIGVNLEVTGLGTLNNRTTNAGSSLGNLGYAVDQVVSSLDPVGLTKRFDDPVPPGGTTNLVFTLTNSTRDTVTGINFTDDLDATLSGLVANGPFLLSPCGAGSSISGSSLLSFSGGSLASGESCTFSVEVTVPGGAAAGSYPNTTSNVGSSAGTYSPATDTLNVGYAPVLVKEFCESGAATTDPCVAVEQVEDGELITARFTVSNPHPSTTVTDLTFDDDFIAFVGAASVTPFSVPGACGAGSTFFDIDGGSSNRTYRLIDGSLAAGASCTFQVDVQLPSSVPPGTYINQTTPILGDYGSGQVAGNRGVDQVSRGAAPQLSKTFDDPVGAGDTVDLVYTLDASESPEDFTNIAFTDDLGAALTNLTVDTSPLSPCGGALSTGGGVVSLSGASLTAGDTCTFTVVLQVPVDAAPASYPSTTSTVTATAAGEPVVGSPASDNLDIAYVDFQKGFIDDPVVSGGTVTLTFFIDNLSADPLTALSFTDNLGAVLTGLAPTDMPQSNICGAGSSASFSGGVLTITGGNLAVGENCTFSTVLQVPAGTAAGNYANVTSNLTGSADGTPFVAPGAVDSVLVTDPLALTKEFIDDPAAPGGTVTLEFTVTNTSPSDTISNIAFTDNLDAVFSGLVSASGAQAGVCGVGSQLSGTNELTLTGGELAPGASCTFSATLSIPASASGSTVNTTSTVTGTIGGVPIEGTAATDTLQINNVTFTKSFSGPSTATGAVTLSFTIENLDAGNGVSGLSFTDTLSSVMAGLVATNTPQSNVCGAGSLLGGTSLLTFTGGDLGPGDSCSFSVQLQVPASATAGSYTNTTSNLTSNGLLVADPASDALQIEPPPTFAKVFAPSAIALSGTSTLTFTIDNSASAVAATSLDFTDNLPAGLQVSGTPNGSTTCTGGTLTAVAGSSTVSYTGATVGAGSVCTVQVDIISTAEGNFINTTGDLTSSSGNSGTATDTLDVVTGDFVMLKSFRSQPVLPGGLVEMELSFVNGSAFALTDIALTDDLDAVLSGLVAEGLPIADACGTGSNVSGTSTVTVTGGNLAAGGSCTIVVPVRVPAGAASGTYTNTTSVATGSRGGIAVEATAASGDLVVESLAFTAAIDPSTVQPGSTTTATFEIINPDPANALSGLGFSFDLDAFVPGMTATTTPLNDACGTGSVVNGTSTVALTGGAIAAGGSCSFQVVLSIPVYTAPGSYSGVTSELASDLGSTAGAPVSLSVGEAAPLPAINTLWLTFMTLLMAIIGWRALRVTARTGF